MRAVLPWDPLSCSLALDRGKERALARSKSRESWVALLTSKAAFPLRRKMNRAFFPLTTASRQINHSLRTPTLFRSFHPSTSNMGVTVKSVSRTPRRCPTLFSHRDGFVGGGGVAASRSTLPGSDIADPAALISFFLSPCYLALSLLPGESEQIWAERAFARTPLMSCARHLHLFSSLSETESPSPRRVTRSPCTVRT